MKLRSAALPSENSQVKANSALFFLTLLVYVVIGRSIFPHHYETAQGGKISVYPLRSRD